MGVSSSKPSERKTIASSNDGGTKAPSTPTRQREKLMRAVDAVEAALGFRPHVSTVHRWKHRGVKFNGETIYLEAYMVGGQLLASEEAAHRFADATNQASDTRNSGIAPVKPRSDSKREIAVSDANARLDKAGI